MVSDNWTVERLKTKKIAAHITIGVLRAAVIINVIVYFVRTLQGRPLGLVLLTPALACIFLGILVYAIKRKIEDKLRKFENGI